MQYLYKVAYLIDTLIVSLIPRKLIAIPVQAFLHLVIFLNACILCHLPAYTNIVFSIICLINGHTNSCQCAGFIFYMLWFSYFQALFPFE